MKACFACIHGALLAERAFVMSSCVRLSVAQV